MSIFADLRSNSSDELLRFRATIARRSAKRIVPALPHAAAKVTRHVIDHSRSSSRRVLAPGASGRDAPGKILSRDKILGPAEALLRTSIRLPRNVRARRKPRPSRERMFHLAAQEHARIERPKLRLQTRKRACPSRRLHCLLPRVRCPSSKTSLDYLAHCAPPQERSTPRRRSARLAKRCAIFQQNIRPARGAHFERAQ